MFYIQIVVSLVQDKMEENINDIAKQQNKVPCAEFEDPQPSDDDDDFPDEQEIFKANGLLKLQKTLSRPVRIQEN